MEAQEFDNASEEALLAMANERLTLLEKVGYADRPALLLEAQMYLAAVTKKRDEKVAARDLEMAQHTIHLEKIVIGLICLEVLLSFVGLWAGYQQGKLLEKQTTALIHMDSSTAATADSLQKLIAAQDASLKILQQQETERAKKPRFALYVGNVPLDKASVRLAFPLGEAQASRVNFDLVIKNVGDVPANEFKLRILAPEYANFNLQLPPWPEYEQPTPGSRGFTYDVPLMPVGKNLHIRGEVVSPNKGQSSFKVFFTVTSPQLASVTPLGSLTVLPAKQN